MNIATIAMVVFFGAFGLNFFVPFEYAQVVMAVSALVAAIALLIGR